MIKSFKYKGLQLFFESGNLKGIQADHAKKLRMRLAALDTAMIIEDLKLPGFDLHELEGTFGSLISSLHQVLQGFLAQSHLFAAHNAAMLVLDQILLGQTAGCVLGCTMVHLRLAADSRHLGSLAGATTSTATTPPAQASIR